jgi:hypothetical protein
MARVPKHSMEWALPSLRNGRDRCYLSTSTSWTNTRVTFGEPRSPWDSISSREVGGLLFNRKVHYLVHKTTSVTPVLNQIKQSTTSHRVRFEVFTAVTMKNAVFWDVKTQFVPHRKHYYSATEPSRLMLRKIWGFQGGDYKECRLLGYKDQVRT